MMPPQMAGGAPGTPPQEKPPVAPGGAGGPPPDAGEMIQKVPLLLGGLIQGLGNLPPEIKQMFEQSAAMWQKGIDMMSGGDKEAEEAPIEEAPPAPKDGGRRQFIG